MSAEMKKVDGRDPWFVHAPASREQLLTAASMWRNEAARGGTEQYKQACLNTAYELEAKASALARIGGAV